MSKKILMIAGPNGAGKTTMTLELIADCPMLYEYINADDIAKSLAPLHPESMALTASKLMIKRLQELLKVNKSFAFETTASGKNYIKYLKLAKAQEYEINLTFLWLANPEHAIKRVAQRVRQGGHHVPKDIIIRRYFAGIKNLVRNYLPLADRALIIDNSVEGPSRKVVAKKDGSHGVDVLDKDIWMQMERIASEE